MLSATRVRVLLTVVLSVTAVRCQDNRQTTTATQFHVIREWDYLNFTWPSEDVYQSATATGNYVPENIIMSGIQWHADRYFLALPRMKSGVPATLVTVSAAAGPTVDTSPLLAPYPSWEKNTVGNCEALQNVQNIAVDSKGNLWVIDGGRTNTLTKAPLVHCTPKLVIIDTATNEIKQTVTFAENIAMQNGSFLYDLVIDEDGPETFAYITDNSGVDPGIIVYARTTNKSWKIRDDGSMRAFLEAHTFKVNGVEITAPINLAGIALGPKYLDTDYRRVYYTPISSYKLFSISTEILRNESYDAVQVHPYVKAEGRRVSQTDGMVMDASGVLYYGLLSNSSIAKWDSRTPFNSSQKLIAKDVEYIQWPNAFTFDANGNIVVLTNKLQKFIYGQLNLFEPNFRILTAYTGSKSYVMGAPMQMAPPVPEPAPEPVPNQDSSNTLRYDVSSPNNNRNNDNSAKQSSGGENVRAFCATALMITTTVTVFTLL